jgi:stage II sporulation protein D
MKSKIIFIRKLALVILLLLLLTVLAVNLNKPLPETIPQPMVKLYLHQSGQIIELEIEEYVAGVVAAEMPASFELEALKAQAVCARTYACKKILDGKPYPLNADLSDDISSCQAYVSWDKFQELHPAKYQELKEKIQSAVEDTRGELITYQNSPIDALYHSTCGGHTESAVAAWGSNIPYLQSVKCNYCREYAYYESTQVISLGSLQEKLTVNGNADIEISQKSDSGRVRQLRVNEQVISAGSFRQLFNLPSTNWELSRQEQGIIVNSRGYGHGVGLCQYGANGLAQQGKDYQQILSHYYKNIRIKKLNY